MADNHLTDKIRALARRGKLDELLPLVDAEPALLQAPEGRGHGMTFLWEAVRHGHKKLVDELHARGADFDFTGRNRAKDLVMRSPLCVALDRGRTSIRRQAQGQRRDTERLRRGVDGEYGSCAGCCIR